MTPPIIPDLDLPPAPDRPATPKADRLPLWVCVLDPSDAGEACSHCGKASGTGHGRKQ